MNFYEIWGWLHFLALMKTQTIFVFTVREKINARGSHAREQARITRKLSSHVPSKGRAVKETPDYDFPQWLTRNRAWGTLKRNNFANHVVRCGHFKSAIARVFDKRSLNFFKHLFTALAYKIRNCSASLSFQFKRCF